MNMYCVIMMIVFGGLISTSCLVGKSLGKGDHESARTYMRVSIMVNGFIGLIAGMILFGFREEATQIFTD